MQGEKKGERENIHPILSIINSNLPRNLYHRTLRGTLTRRPREPDKSQNTTRIDDPASIPRGMRFLLHHLLCRVFTAKPDTLTIYEHRSIVNLVGCFMNTKRMGMRGFGR